MSRFEAPKSRFFGLAALGGWLSLAGTVSLGLGGSASAQQPALRSTAPEKGFTIAANAHTPMVLRTEPHAACDMHPSGINDPAHNLKVYANADGYVKVHLTATQESQDVHVQLDCATGNAVTIHPVHFHTGPSPTADMPAPESSVPMTTGARVVPALTEEAAKQLSDDEVVSLGYPPRPDAETAAEQYAHWLRMVSGPLTVIPPHSVNTERVHAAEGVISTTSLTSAKRWSGFVAQRTWHSFMGVTGQWNVPPGRDR